MKKTTKKVVKKVAKKAIKKSIVKKAVAKASSVIQKVKSYAGSDAQYAEHKSFPGLRLRVIPESKGRLLRLHIHKSVLRNRDSYVAVDLPKDVLASVLKAA